jgi:hypothetical protein
MYIHLNEAWATVCGEKELDIIHFKINQFDCYKIITLLP